ncbi:MAG: class I SAM-dependent methyltransferase [Nanoarchaeota archaeon]
MIKKTVDEIKKSYNSQDYYDLWRDKSKYYNIITEITQRCIKENICFVSKEKKVLDAGCGTGRNIQLLLNLGAKKVVGIDLTPKLLDFAKNKFKSNKKIQLFQHNLEEKLPFKNESFDVVICCKALPHVNHIKQTLNEFNRVLKKRGIMMIDFYSPYSFRRLFANKDYLRYTRWDPISRIKRHLKTENLEITKVYGERTFMITEFLVNNFGLYRLFRWLENKFTNNNFFNKLSGIYTVVAKKP